MAYILFYQNKPNLGFDTMIKIIVCLIGLCLLNVSVFANSDIDKVLDTFHQAAGDADQKIYLDLLDEQAVFLGTDGQERWTKKQFTEFVTPYFSQGQGWRYKSRQRNITLIASVNNSEQLAFFDELLDNSHYGECRGSGVLKLTSDGWRILQYNLSIPVPNTISTDVVSKIKEYHQKNR
jgi:hypothetical protein